ncbi:hypothetical protein CROQUDRAFT_665119 [Cronartium quercuum f. sp. fusiforme G11]|uniref:Uncharacterized protein n=1 Tax=Cronartium quercuum f. sp. fusiforme G11 TaxID=708437 RepID=A0A9P6T7J1_9BASI|nr:hypothetical protein CROQUDRAFT_665119 [Cronartium quercuum f. sp. fusiforme G11]
MFLSLFAEVIDTNAHLDNRRSVESDSGNDHGKLDSQSESSSQTHLHSSSQSHSTSDDSTDDHSVFDTPEPPPDPQNN